MKSGVILIFVLMCAWGASAQVTDVEDIKIQKVAEAQIQEFVKDIPENDLAGYGFKSKAGFSQITFGKPIPVFTLQGSEMVFTDTWRVPVVIGGEYRSLLTVIREADEFKAVDFGACELAKAYDENKTLSTYGLLRVYEIKKDYLIEGREVGNQLFIPTDILIRPVLSAFKSLSAQVLNVSKITQTQSEWCWAGVSACVLEFYGKPVSQCEIAEYTRTHEQFSDISFGNTDCCLNPVSCNNWNYNWGGPGSIDDILLYFAGITNNKIGSYIPLSEIAALIESNRLFIARWGWTSGGGHFIVGHGISGDNIYYMNPWPGEGKKIGLYSWIQSASDHTWTHTNVCTVSARPPEAAQRITGETTVCQGNSAVRYSIPSIDRALSYEWSLPEGALGRSGADTIWVSYGKDAVSGEVTVAGVNNLGAGPPSALSVTVDPRPDTPAISQKGNDLTSSSPVGNQWFNSAGPVEGANSQTYTATASDDYYVVVTRDGCPSDPSGTVSFILNGLKDIPVLSRILVYPNPCISQLFIENEEGLIPIRVTILNSLGQSLCESVLLKKETIDMGDLAAGIYLLKLEAGGEVSVQKVVKK